MGWTSYHAKFYKANGDVDRKKELDELATWENEKVKSSVVKSRMVGSTYYAAVKREETDVAPYVFGVVILTVGKDRRDPYFNFGYKDMTENMGPGYYDCPKSILDLLTPTDNAHANEWRRLCRERVGKTKLGDLPVGTLIRFTTRKGDECILKKKAPNYQFKRTWWYNAENNTYMPKNRIPDSWEILKED